MSLVKWAEEELERIGKDEEGMQELINENILDIVKLFAKQGHSGTSANYTLNILKRLLDWKPIQPLTGEESEWGEVESWDDGTNIQQNKRCSAVFRSNFDNLTAHYIDGKVFSDNGGKNWFTNGKSIIQVKFPFTVPDKPEYIILK